MSFTITPALKNELIEFIEMKKVEDPENVEYKSVSSFCYYIIKDSLEIKKKGLDFKNLKNIPDTKTVDFYDKISFKAIIPLFEPAVEFNKYCDTNIKIPSFLFAYWRYFQSLFVDREISGFPDLFKKFKDFLLSNNLTREFRLDEFSEKNNLKGIIEYIGVYDNLHYNNCKAVAALLSIMGGRITNFDYSKQDLYARFDVQETDLVKRKETAKKERMKLLEENMKHFVNYEKIVKDIDEHLWIKLAGFKDLSFTYYTESTFKNFIESIVEDFRIYGEKEDILFNLLKIFEHFHWISIENKIELSFRVIAPSTSVPDVIQNQVKKQIDIFRKECGDNKGFTKITSLLAEELQSKEIQFMFAILKKYASFEKKGNLYHLAK